MSNTLTNVLPTILADGVSALRQNAVFSRLVTRDYQQMAQSAGNVVTVPIPSAIPARAVTPGVTFAANQDSNPTSAQVTLSSWFESPLNLSDSDNAATRPDFLRMQSTEAVKSLVNTIDASIWGVHTGFFAFTGSAGSTPFNGSLLNAANVKKLLSINLAPVDGRNIVIDPVAEANAIMIPEVLRSEARGDQGGIIKGVIGTKLGMDWYMNQNVGTYTPGVAWVTGYSASTVAGAVADTTLNIVNATASGSIKVGDIFTVGSGQYVITAAATVTSSAGAGHQVAVAFYPGLATAVATGSAIAVLATAYTANIAFLPGAIAFANRPLSSVFQAGNMFQTPVDDVSGIALRLELSRQYKQETVSFDSLWGTNVVRRELGAKVLG